MHRSRILIVEDDLSTVKFLQANLKARGYETFVAIDGLEALKTIEMELPDLVILDIMLPKMDGFEICRRIRQWSLIPIIMLSARHSVEEKVKCLDLGADDYITKPFGVEELLARIRVALRRSKAAGNIASPPSFTSGDLKINFVQRQVTIAGAEAKLTATEDGLLQELVLNAGKVLDHAYLLRKVWGPEAGQERQYLRHFIRRLRTKLEPDPKNPRYIITVPGMGYQFKAPT